MAIIKKKNPSISDEGDVDVEEALFTAGGNKN